MIAALVLAFVAGLVAGAYLGGRTCAHAWTLHLSPSRMWLECPRCGATSPGWDLSIANLHPRPTRVLGGPWPTVQ
jgi:hypothetical protein